MTISSGSMFGLFLVLFIYGVGCFGYLTSLWLDVRDAKSCTKETVTADLIQKRRRAARYTLTFPLWLVWVLLELLWWLFGLATASGPKKEEEVGPICPSCRERGPFR